MSRFAQANRKEGADALALKAILLEKQAPKFMPPIDAIGLALNSLDGSHLLICVSLRLGALWFNSVFQGVSTQSILIKYF